MLQEFACTTSPRSSPGAVKVRFIVSRRVWGAGSPKFVEHELMKSMTQVGKTCWSLAAISVCGRHCKGEITARPPFLPWTVLGTGKLWGLQPLSGVLGVGATSHQGTLMGNLVTHFLLMPPQLWVWSPGLWATEHHQVCVCCKEGAVAQGVSRSLSAPLSLYTTENRNCVFCSWLLSAVEFLAVLHCTVKGSWRGESEGPLRGNSLYKSSPNIHHFSATILYGLFNRK